MPGGGKDGARIQLGAGFRRADREALALEVGQRLDAALGGGDDLDVVRIDRADGAQLVELGLEAGFLVAVPGRLQGVAEREGELARAPLQQHEVFDRGLGGLDLGFDVRNLVAEDFSDGDAERVIDAGSTAGEHIDEALRHGRWRRQDDGGSDGDGKQP